MRLPADTSDRSLFEEALAEARYSKPDTDIFSIKPKFLLYWIDSLQPVPLRYPFSQPILSQDRIGDLKLVYESNHHLFHMNDDFESRIYATVKDRAYNEWYVITKEETKWDENNNVLVWLEWVQRYYEL